MIATDPERIAQRLQEERCTLAVAESLTGGMVSSRLAAAPGASEWFRGAVVAYSREVKYDVLGVPVGPVVSEEAAAAMATGVAELLGADVGLALTGVGGPDPQDGESPGTVWLALCQGGDVRTERLSLAGDPQQVCGDAAEHALMRLAGYIGAG